MTLLSADLEVKALQMFNYQVLTIDVNDLEGFFKYQIKSFIIYGLD